MKGFNQSQRDNMVDGMADGFNFFWWHLTEEGFLWWHEAHNKFMEDGVLTDEVRERLSVMIVEWEIFK